MSDAYERARDRERERGPAQVRLALDAHVGDGVRDGCAVAEVDEAAKGLHVNRRELARGAGGAIPLRLLLRHVKQSSMVML